MNWLRTLQMLGRWKPGQADGHDNAKVDGPRLLILTPVKDAVDCIPGYCERLMRLTHPHHLISIGLLESDSTDTTFRDLQRRLPSLRAEFRRVGLWKRDFGYRVPPGIHRGAPAIQIDRRTVLALAAASLDEFARGAARLKGRP